MKTDYFKKGLTQRVITLISIIVILVFLFILIAYNSMNKAKTENIHEEAVNTELSKDNTEKESTNKQQEASAPAETQKASETLPSDASEEEKAMAELKDIKVDNAAEAMKKKGKIAVDGSSMVGGISQLVADKYKQFYKNVQVTVEVSGTEEGMNYFSAGKIDICGTTRRITSEEAAACKGAGIDYAEIKLGYDAVAVVVNKGNNWVDAMSITEMRKIWDSKGRARLWSDVNAAWPGSELKLYSSKLEALSRNFFCTALYSNGSVNLSKYNTEVDDNKAWLEGITSDAGAAGFCGYAFYESNKDKLKAVGIITAEGPVMPSYETIKSGAYSPLSRTMYLYVNKNSLGKDYIKAFVKMYLENVSKFVKAAGYLPCEDTEYQKYIDSLN
ncbi:MAG: substrate-binding domain-containing protein [Clostridia bacterium]|nr:substrate-binding domain-containing protein [Clostridia bacterium]